MNGLTVRNRQTGRTYTAYTQSVDINFNGKYSLRYVIGIQGYTEFSFVEAIYDNDEFNERYEVIK